jgi:hypothetical protein
VLAGARLTSVALQVGHAAQADGNVKRGTDTDTHTHTKGHVKHNNNIIYIYAHSDGLALRFFVAEI